MSFQNQIPVELLELIVENVDAPSSERRQTLVACSYANRALSVMCQKRIFKDIQIRQKGGSVSRLDFLFTEAQGADGHRFLKLIKTKKSRHIATYVRNLTIDIVKEPRTHVPVKPDSPLYSIVPRLRNLKRFAINSSIPGMSVEWHTVGRPFKTFLSGIAQRLPEIDFRFFSDMGMSTFYNCPALEVLHIQAVHMRKKVPPCRANLRFLDFGYLSPSPHVLPPNDILEHFDSTYSPLNITHLTGLKLSSINFLPSDIDNILALCSNTLESLDLRVGQYAECKLSYSLGSFVSRSEATPPNLSSLRNLYSLTLRTDIDGYSQAGEEDFYHSNTPFVSTILRTLPQTMHFPFELVFYTYLSGFPIDRLARFPWSDVVDVLDLDPFSGNLTTIHFTFRQSRFYQQEYSISNQNHLIEILNQNDGLRRLGKKNIRLVSTDSDFDD